jgi:hypothetical protein
MFKTRRLLTTGMSLLLALTLSPMALAAGNNAEVRVVHASPDAPPVDVLVNNAIRAFEGIPFDPFNPSEGITDYAGLPAGVYNIKVVPEGGEPGDEVIEADLNLFYDTDYTVVAVDFLDSIDPVVMVDDNTPADLGSVKLRFLHASPDAPPVDIRVADGPYLWQEVEFKEIGDYLTIPAGRYDIQVLIAGTSDVALPLNDLRLESGTTYTVYAVGEAFSSPATLNAIFSVDSVNRIRTFFDRLRERR